MELNATNASVKVTPELLMQNANDAEEKINAMNRQLQEIQRIVKGTRSYWIGDAGDACRKQYEDAQKEIDVIMDRLKKQPKTLLTIAGIFHKGDKAAEGMSMPLPSNVVE